MAYGRRVSFEPVREMAFGSIGASYTAFTPVTTHYGRIVAIENTTDVDVYISVDGSTNALRIASGSGQVFDLCANEVPDDGFFFSEQTTFYCKAVSTSPSKGAVWIEYIYASGGV